MKGTALIASFDPSLLERFKAIQPDLAKVVEDHLPGDFSSWEEENTSWDGPTKIAHNSWQNPNTDACVWRIFMASANPDELLGREDLEANMCSLEALENSLSEAVRAVGDLSPLVLHPLSSGSIEKLRTLYSPPRERVDPPAVTLLLIEQALKEGIRTAKERLSQKGAKSTRADLRAAAVARACQDVYERRTGRPAPKSVRDKQQVTDEPTPFTSFTEEIFRVLGVNSKVSSALRRSAIISN